MLSLADLCRKNIFFFQMMHCISVQGQSFFTIPFDRCGVAEKGLIYESDFFSLSLSLNGWIVLYVCVCFLQFRHKLFLLVFYLHAYLHLKLFKLLLFPLESNFSFRNRRLADAVPIRIIVFSLFYLFKKYI